MSIIIDCTSVAKILGNLTLCVYQLGVIFLEDFTNWKFTKSNKEC